MCNVYLPSCYQREEEIEVSVEAASYEEYNEEEEEEEDEDEDEYEDDDDDYEYSEDDIHVEFFADEEDQSLVVIDNNLKMVRTNLEMLILTILVNPKEELKNWKII